MVRKSAPASSKWVAKQCRRMWGEQACRCCSARRRNGKRSRPCCRRSGSCRCAWTLLGTATSRACAAVLECARVRQTATARRASRRGLCRPCRLGRARPCARSQCRGSGAASAPTGARRWRRASSRSCDGTRCRRPRSDGRPPAGKECWAVGEASSGRAPDPGSTPVRAS